MTHNRYINAVQIPAATNLVFRTSQGFEVAQNCLTPN